MKKFLIAVLFLASSVMALDHNLFYKIMAEPTPAWMVLQIEKDLAPFGRELSEPFLDALYREKAAKWWLVRIRAVNGVLSIDKRYSHPTALTIYDGIEKLHRLAPLPDMDLLLSGEDTLTGIHTPSLPVFIEAKPRGSNSFILLPDRFALHGYHPQKDLVLEGNTLFPWETKKEVLFFRGSDTGANPITWRDCPRPRLVALSLQYPDLIDARFAEWLHFRGWLETAKREGLMGKAVSMKEHLMYKYLIDVDGNCASCPRTATLFHGNSVVFKQMSESMQWFYSTLEPYVHYIPVQEDLSDLVVQILWAKEHDRECREISLNGRFLARDVLSEERIFQYLYRLLEAYSKRQKEFYCN